MSKEIWKAGTNLYPVPVVMISCGEFDKDEKNIITVAWTGTLNSDPAMAYVSIRPSRYSHEIIKRTGEFVINLCTKDLAFATDYCGVKSGKNVDKFKEMNLTAIKAPNTNCPVIEQSPLSIECRVKDIVSLGTHDMFIGEVLSSLADEKYMDEDGKFHFNKSEPICYSHGQYYSLGDQLGKFGFSVKKNK
ncbi:MAG: flavin reductase family protein [bacterium]